MRILVLGAGAVGGYFGGRLAQKGSDVTFLVRAKRAETLARDGLRISSRFGDFRKQVQCVTQDQVKPAYDIVMLTAKAYDLAAAIDAIAPAMGEGKGGRGLVLPLLNGMAHLEMLDRRFGRERVLGGVAYIAATLAPDGEVRHLNDFHRVVFGPRAETQRAACDALAAELAGVNFEWKRLEAIEQAMWDKWVLLATLAGITCLMRAPVGDIVATASGAKLTLALLGECAGIAAAEGFPTPEESIANYRGMLTQAGSAFTASMLRDIETGGQTEGEHILGALLARARQRDLRTPVLEVAATHLEAYAARRRRETAATQPPARPGPSAAAR
ncbi:MAG: ketopantoate reductase family protein [Betaproteobacteria bacterium]|nr:ketopantoate reductase family protein [Betaproteobacteria bacterium]